LRTDWFSEALDNACVVEYGTRVVRKKDGGSIYPVYGGGGETFKMDTFNREDRVIVSRFGVSDECVRYVVGKFFLNDSGLTVTTQDPNRLTQRFLDYELFALNESIYELCRGTAQKNLDVESFRRLNIVAPKELSEQQRIVAVMDEVFAGLATATANVKKNLKNAGELRGAAINSAIVGNLTKDWRDAHLDVDSALSHLERTLALRRQHWKGSVTYNEPDAPVSSKPIRLPKGWVLASPEQICTHIVDCPHRTPKWTNAGELCLRTTNFRPGFLDLETVRFVSEATYIERVERLEPRPSDIVYSREGGILGIACLIPEGLKACLGQRMMLFRVDTNVVLPEFFMCVLNSSLILSEVARLVGGAASPHLNIRDIRRFPIPLPPLVEQRQIVAKLDTVLVETRRLEDHYESKITSLGLMKQSILQKAFSGELTSPPSLAIKEAAE
jgi:type I restriction enzyme S subunit